MAIYEYCCAQDGVFEVMRRMGTAEPTAACPTCGAEAPRIVSAPRVRSASRGAWHAAVERADNSRYEPAVVSSPPPLPRGRSNVLPLTPVLRGLPRP
ncbi:MAG: zinc ribbon domain-containing protein [Proteobacteria bacterium]|nr:zinc ribbon domain-containing protein [Pseudomonadota bacterium]